MQSGMSQTPAFPDYATLHPGYVTTNIPVTLTIMPDDNLPDWNNVYRDIYKTKAFDEGSWIECANSLLESARLLEPKILELWDNYNAHANDHSVKLRQDHYNGPYFMLMAFAVENILKAALVRAESSNLAERFEQNSKFPKELKGHDLLILAKAARITIGFENEDLLRRLTRNAIWSGRYPVPLYHCDSHNSEVYSDGGQYLVAFFGATDIERLRTFVEKIRCDTRL